VMRKAEDEAEETAGATTNGKAPAPGDG
jgi:hypothetical protein